MSAVLQTDDRMELVRILAGMDDLSSYDTRGRRLLLELAGLGRFLPSLDLTGPPRLFAGDLVNMLERYGPLPGQSTYHALGALLSYVLSLDELPQAQASFVARQIVKYSLVSDSVYQTRLRDKYDVGQDSPMGDRSERDQAS